MICKDCELFKNKYYPCEIEDKEKCTDFFPKEEALKKYMWILTVDVRSLITFIEAEAKKQKNYILDKLISRLKKEIEKKSLSVEKSYGI